MSRILFFDDNPARHELMNGKFPNDNITHVYDISIFQQLLPELDQFDTIYLDHDLNDFDAQSLLWDGQKATGLDACGMMVKFPTKAEIIIHSSNGQGAAAMVDFLASRGITSYWKMWDINTGI